MCEERMDWSHRNDSNCTLVGPKTFSGRVCWESSNETFVSATANITDEEEMEQICNHAKPGLQQPGLCYSRAQKHYVVNQYVDTSWSGILKTAPSWLFFGGATTSCFKPLGKDILYFERTCSKGDILAEVLDKP